MVLAVLTPEGQFPSGVERVEKVAKATFSSFCKGLHAADWPLLAVNRPHLPLERCKNRRTGRRFLQIDSG